MKFYTNVGINKNNVFVRGFENGKRFQEIVPYEPYLFLPVNKQTGYRTIDGRSVEKKTFSNIMEARWFLKEYRHVSNMEIHGMDKFEYSYIYDNYNGEVQYDSSLINIVTIDIEVASDDGFPDIKKADKPITAITVKRKKTSFVFGCGDFETNDENIKYIRCKDEMALLSNFLKVWSAPSFDPDVVTGWNVEQFDIPYLVNRIRNILGEYQSRKLSPWGILKEEKLQIRDYEIQIFRPLGISVLDYLQLYRKFTYSQQESYRLDHIADVELGERKLDYSEYDSLLELYKNDHQKFIEYNIKDVELVARLDAKLRLIDLAYAMAYDAKVNYEDIFGTVKPWDVIIHNYLMDQRIVIPPHKQNVDDHSVVGGYVKDPQIGMHSWVVSWDFASLYPHIAILLNISPDTFKGLAKYTGLDFPTYMTTMVRKGITAEEAINYLQENNFSYAVNGAFFSKEKQGFFSFLMEQIYSERNKFKKMMVEAKKVYEKEPTEENANKIAQYNAKQMAFKIKANSAYGALANRYFRWYDYRLAEAITMTGQYSIRYMEKKVNEFLNHKFQTEKTDYVIASDTDSLYVSFPSKEAINEEEMNEKISVWCEEIAKNLFAFKPALKMTREVIANKGIWTTKKRYILNVLNSEGVEYSEPKLKIQGIEAVRSSTPNSVRKNIKTALWIIMNKDELSLHQFIEEFKQKFLTLPFEEVAFPRGISDINKYYDRETIYSKGTPIHVKGALLYNAFLIEKKLLKKYQPISNKDKIKFCYLKTPNPLNDIVISTPGTLPKQFGLEDFIDREKQFEKSFIEPLKYILTPIGWSPEKIFTLDSFFN